jgi:hypothetical protein
MYYGKNHRLPVCPAVSYPSDNIYTADNAIAID